MYTKRLLCLASSKKIGGRCVAGRELLGKAMGEWIRPVSGRATHEMSYGDRRYEEGGAAEVLHVIEVPLLKHVPTNHQSENHLIAADRYWRKVAEADWKQVQAAIDVVAGPLWLNDESTQHGVHDKVAESRLNQIPDSLKLVKVSNLSLQVAYEPGWQGRRGKRKVRASFHLNRLPYVLPVTDPLFEAEYLAKKDGSYAIGPSILCISLSEPKYGYAFKLVAAVITRKRVESL